MDFHLASWPGVLGVLVLAVVFAITVRGPRVAAQRAAGLVGLLALVPLFLLGAIWPSAFTIAAVLSLPAGLLLLGAIPRPSLLQHGGVRAYVLVAVFLSPACLIAQTLWLSR